jgi:hypothetical protein
LRIDDVVEKRAVLRVGERRRDVNDLLNDLLLVQEAATVAPTSLSFSAMSACS